MESSLGNQTVKSQKILNPSSQLNNKNKMNIKEMLIYVFTNLNNTLAMISLRKLAMNRQQ